MIIFLLINVKKNRIQYFRFEPFFFSDKNLDHRIPRKIFPDSLKNHNGKRFGKKIMCNVFKKETECI